MHCDVAVIGGGPAGCTVGTLLRKYNPDLKVAIFEAASFPRDHVGESQLPVTPRILDEMEVWDKVEAANFPIKIGASYRWGPLEDNEFWNFFFIQDGKFEDSPRPGRYEGQRTATAFQVDRAVYDKILLDHARDMGCKVYEEAPVRTVVTAANKVSSLLVDHAKNSELKEPITANYFVDASGTSGLIRKAMGVSVDSPTHLRNIAIWDYWQNAEWADSIGIGGTMVKVISFAWGWLWFIPLGPTRTSIGLVTSAEYYKSSGLSTEQIYVKAIQEAPLIHTLLIHAARENKLEATKDWSCVSKQMAGDNWFLTGDVCGFADPILAAGLSLAHVGARRVAYSILELVRGDLDPVWVRSEYQRIHTNHIRNHIRFADYWYTANGRFTDLKEYCAEIAKDSGLTLDPDAAFRWLGTGGFSEEISGLPFAGTYRVGSIKAMTEKFGGKKCQWAFEENNIFDLDLEGAVEGIVGVYEGGRLYRVSCFTKNGKTLPIYHYFGLLYQVLLREREIQLISERLGYQARLANLPLNASLAQITMEILEVLVHEGWVKASYDPCLPRLSRDGGWRKD